MERQKEQIDLSNFTVDAQLSQDAKEVSEAREEKNKEKRQQTILKKIEKQRDEATKAAKKSQAEMEEAYKKDLAFKINLYRERFPFLKDKIPKLPARYSVPEAEEVLYQIRYEMDSQKSLDQIRKYFTYGTMFLETVWGDGQNMTFLPPELRFNLTGLSKVMNSPEIQSELEPIINEIDIEYPSIGRRSLTMRLLETLSQVLLRVHVQNMNPAIKKALNLAKESPLPEKEVDV